ncbi:glutamate synthase [Thiohalorhabdus denitrificans]|uniref:Glutamate synthase (NADH) small subunit n=1 Tax=Thiohalorhabdus denitrificans TaxID=381306 RepID=A0A0P9C876_9GAMM|nr:glutamate synthase subunit beta [Thiohalorhabdus denitrificans]KPV41180.1 glutamate synthase [Thiohalorhabdus denitrificans]SCY35520.1 glutamate synthase (NADH) small subunit [Thiohalorhabdus denitrificans]
MGQIDGFMKFPRHGAPLRPVGDRREDYRELYQEQSDEELATQGARCMDCGIPYCQTDTGCPVDNLIPEWNDLVYRGQWHEALSRLHETNNFPEFTGWLCPAPCESSCTLDLVENSPVTIKNIERNIIERGFDEGWVAPATPAPATGFKVAVVGSGPAGLAAAQQLARWGHAVTVLEKSDRLGGLLRYGIPDFKMQKFRIDRRLEQMRAEGVEFRTSVNVGEDITAEELRAEYDAVILSGGAEKPRDHDVPGRELAGIHYAMPFLVQQNKINEGDTIPEAERISAEGKHVVIIGGGDTGADCVGTSIRQGAKSVKQLNIHAEPPEERSEKTPWPEWPHKRMDSTSHDEGCERLWKVYVKSFEDDGTGRVHKANCVKVQSAQRRPDGTRELIEEPNGDFDLDADLVLLAIGFQGPEKGPLLGGLGVELDKRGNATADPATRMTNVPGVFSAGDMYRGASLIVWAIHDGRHAAEGAHRYLMKQKVAQGLKATAD